MTLPAPPLARDAFPDSHVGVLLDPAGNATALVTATRDAKAIEFRALREIPLEPTRHLLLWSIGPDGTARRIGLVPNIGATHIELGESTYALLAAGAVLVVTAEPRAVTRPEQPALPAVARGQVVRSW